MQARRRSTTIGTWLRSRLRPSRHTLYFEVLDALQQEGCPICRLVERGLSWYLDMLSYEGVNDPAVRRRLRAARGLCNLHAWRFVGDVRNAPGRAIIYRDLLGQPLQSLSRPSAALLTRLPGAPGAADGSGALADELVPRDECPACQSMAHATRRYLETLLLHLPEEELRQRYQASGGLCLPHLDLALPQVRRAGDRALLCEVAARWAGSLRVAGRSGLRDGTLAIVAGAAGRPGGLRPVPPPEPNGHPPAEGMPLPPEPAAASPAPAEGCPVCRAAVPAVDGYLAFLPTVSRARGAGPAFGLQLCAVHAWRSLELLSPGAAARLWQPAARAIRGGLTRESPPGHAPSGQAPEPSRACLACRYQAMVEVRAVRRLLEELEGEQAKGADGLCLPHLALGLRLSPSARARARLVSAQVPALRALRAELDEYIRKQDFDCHERPGPEADSPWRAMSRVAGAQGLGGGVLAWAPRRRSGL